MNAYVFSSLSSAQSFQSAIDLILGFPMAGTPFNGGNHANPSQAITVHYTEITQHPTQQLWRVISDSNTDPIAQTLSLSSSSLDTSWFPIPPVLS